MATLTERIAEVDTAITQVQTSGQSITVDGISYGRANLDALRNLRNDLQGQADRAAGTRPTFRGFNFSAGGYS